MISIGVLLWLIAIHFFGDFIFQFKYGNSIIFKENDPQRLITHSLFYAIPFLIFGAQFAVGSGIIHGLIDLFVLKVTKHYWSKDKMNVVFSLIGLDQALHIATLVLLYSLIGVDYSYYHYIKALF